jgi:hypothetical protein
MDPVSCVSYVSWWYCVYAAETHETIHWKSGMRYQPAARPAGRARFLSTDVGGTIITVQSTQEPLTRGHLILSVLPVGT